MKNIFIFFLIILGNIATAQTKIWTEPLVPGGGFASATATTSVSKVAATSIISAFAGDTDPRFITYDFNSIDVGNLPAPAITDLDGDGLLDLLIGNYNGDIVHYEQASVNSLSFTLISTTFNDIDAGIVSKPAITDLDGDGLLDLLIGNRNGNIAYYEQVSTSSLSFMYVTNSFNSIDIDGYASPSLTDLDSDGLIDLLVGTDDGNILHYEQASTHSLSFTHRTDTFNNINLGSYSSPFFIDSDGNGLLDLWLGYGIPDSNYQIAHFEQTSTSSGSFILINNNFNPNTHNLTTVLADLDKDGFLDMLVGGVGGNISHYEQTKGNFSCFSTPLGTPSTTQSLQVFGKDLQGNIIITAPTHYEVSLSPSSGFGSSVSLTQSEGKVLNTTVYVRYNPSVSGIHIGDLTVRSINANTVSFALSSIIAPTDVKASSNAICNGNSINLTASGCSGSTITWYTQATGGTAIGYGSSLNQSPTVNTTYYASCISGYCESNRVSTGLITVTIQPNVPTDVEVDKTSICSGSSVSLTATCATGTITWYNQATGGTAIGTGSPLSQNPVVNTTYYASCRSNDCESSRVATGSVTVLSVASATISYAGSPYSKTASPANVTLAGTTGGTFTSVPVGLIINSSTGQITPASSTAGTYTVTYEIASSGACPTYTATTSVSIVASTPIISAFAEDTDPHYLNYILASYTIKQFFSPAFIDLDGDGLLDLLVGNNNGNIFHYEQIYADSSSFIPIIGTFTSIDVGDRAIPTFTDLDGDGLIDLLIGSKAGVIWHYEQASANSSSFVYVTNFFNSIDVGGIASPTFTDLDGDGLLDLVIGSEDGDISHYEQASANSLSFRLITNNFNNINIGDNSSPFFIDSNGDGLLELWLSYKTHNVNSTGAIVNFEQAAVNSTIFTSFGGYSKTLDYLNTNVVLTDLDKDGLLDMFVGDQSDSPTSPVGFLYHYEQRKGNFSCFITPTGTPSATQSLQIFGKDLQENINITAPTHYEVSLSPSSGFGSSVSLTPSAGRVMNTTVYVRYNPSVSGIHTGDLTVSSTNANTFTFALNSIIAPTDVQTSSNAICSGNSLTLTADGCSGGTVRWYNQATGGTAIGTGSPLSQSPTVNTTYYASCKSGDCESNRVSTGLITVTIQPNVPTDVEVDKTSICSGSSVSLTATCATGTITWYNQATGGTAIGTGSPINQSPMVRTTYFASCKTGSCESNRVSTEEILIKSPVTANISYADSPYCKSVGVTNVTRTGPSPGTFTSSPTGLNINSSSGQINPSLSTPGVYTITYTVTAVLDCMSPTATTSVTIMETPTANITGTTNLTCTTTSVTRTASGGGTYQWSGGLGTNATANISSPGAYTVTVTGTNGCTATATTIINFVNDIQAGASNTGPYAINQKIELSASGGTQYNWSGPASFTSSLQNPGIENALVSNAGIYTVTVTAGICSSTTTTQVVVSGIDPCTQVVDYQYVKAGNPYQPMFSLTNGMVIQQIPEQVSIMAVPVCPNIIVGSIDMTIVGPEINWTILQNVEPFAIFDNLASNFNGRNFTPGTYTMTITGYLEDNRAGGIVYGPVVTTFTVVGNMSTIAVPTVSTNTLCAGGNVEVSFSTTGDFSPINTYQIELSDTLGRFINPLIIGISNAPGTILCQLPEVLQASNKYLIRVTSTNQVIVSNPTINFLSSIPVTKNLVSDFISGNITERTSAQITANNRIISPAEVTYNAGKAIVLNPGFVAEIGSVFKAEIRGCQN